MAEITRGTGASLATPLPPNNAKVGMAPAGEALPAGAACRFTTTGTTMLSSGAANNASAVVDGWTMTEYAVGEMATLYNDVTIGYGSGGTAIVPGTFYYLSGTVPGGIADAASTGGLTPIARGVPDNSVSGTKQHKLRVKRSY